jgi:hypothetical protein
MILNPEEYRKLFKLNGRYVHSNTIKNRCKKGLMPGYCEVRKVGGRWIIWVPDNKLPKNRFLNLKEAKEKYYNEVILPELNSIADLSSS